MENFILWDASYEAEKGVLSFFAAPVQVQCIHRGTKQMVSTMLADMEIDVSFATWDITPFVTNYLADDEESDDWEDVWQWTQEITVPTQNPVALETDSSKLVRTRAFDATWKGEAPSLPVACRIIADFYDTTSKNRVEKILSALSQSKAVTGVSSELQGVIPTANIGVLEELQESYRNTEGASFSICHRTTYPNQLTISIGVFSDNFFVQGAVLANRVRQLCHLFDGTTTWDDKTSREYRSL